MNSISRHSARGIRNTFSHQGMLVGSCHENPFSMVQIGRFNFTNGAMMGFESPITSSKKKPLHHSKRIGKDYRTFFGFMVVVPENYALLLHRFKKYTRQLKPGLNFKWPIIDSIEFVHDLREQAIEISS